MRYSRIIAAIVLSSALIFLLCFGSSAAFTYTDTLYCDHGLGVYFPLNSGAQKWVEFTPTVNDAETRFTFSNIDAELVNGNYEYAFDRFVFLFTPNDNFVEFAKGYIYTYNFTVRSTKVSDVNQSAFSFGVTDYDFSFATPLGNVVYTYDFSGSTTVNYYITVSFYVDDSPTYNSLPHPEEAYLYLQISTEWSDTFSLIGSNMTVEKSVGEDAYYQASLDAIQNLPDTEYNYVLNKMSESEGELTVMSDELLDIMAEFDPELKRGRDLFTSDLARPCVYLPDIDIPFLKIHVMDKGVRYLDTYLNEMNPMILEWIAVLLNFVRLVVCVTFFTSTWYKMARIEWWY